MKSSRYSLSLLLALSTSAVCATSATFAGARTPVFAPAAEQPLSAESQQQIRSLVNESAAASAKNDWEAAHSALLKAWDIKPLPMIAANLGYVEIKMSRYREAAEHLRFFIDKAPADHPERRADAEQQLTECRKHVAVIQVIADLDGVQVTMDGSEIGQTPLPNQLIVDPGAHTIEVTRLGYQSESRSISLEAGDDTALRFTLVAEPGVAIQSAPAVQALAVQPLVAERPGIQPRTWALIGGSAATAVSLGIGIGYRLRANRFESDANSTTAKLGSSLACADPTGDAQTLCPQLKSTLRQQDTAVNVSTGCFVAAGVLGVATAVTYLWWPKRKPKPSQPMKSELGVAPLTLGKTQGFQFYTTF